MGLVVIGIAVAALVALVFIGSAVGHEPWWYPAGVLIGAAAAVLVSFLWLRKQRQASGTR